MQFFFNARDSHCSLITLVLALSLSYRPPANIQVPNTEVANKDTGLISGDAEANGGDLPPPAAAFLMDFRAVGQSTESRTAISRR